jgi:site-specific recombinase
MAPPVSTRGSLINSPHSERAPDSAPRSAGKPPEELVDLTEAFCAASTLSGQMRRIAEIFSFLWDYSDADFTTGIVAWVSFLEQDPQLCSRFHYTWQAMLAQLDSVSFFAEAGLPVQTALLPETARRIFQRVLPAARDETDTARIFTAVFASPHAVKRFLDLDPATFARLAVIFWDPRGLDAFPGVYDGLQEALRLLAARVAGRGSSRGVRQRSTTREVQESPFYRLIFATERFIRAEPSESPDVRHERWLEAVYACRGELALVRLHMEDTGVSTGLVFDLSVMDAALDRMELLAAALASYNGKAPAAARRLLDTLFSGLLADTRISAMIRQNLNLVARKTVERTGHSGEHYIAQTRRGYWRMWGAAIGGGFLTVFTAAIKLHIVGRPWPPFIEGFLVGTNYAISFVLLQIFGLALATKQPSMTAATLADIIRRNRGVERRDKIVDFAASISRTQIAAALGNILAVSAGAIVFSYIWGLAHHQSAYLPAHQAEHVYRSLSPIASGTVIYAAVTGVLLWLAALIGGWCENFAIYNRIPDAIAQHPLGHSIGARPLRQLANWVDRNIAPWSNSIALGYLMGFTPEIAHFLGVPLDVRHVTLNTGMFVFAAAAFGLGAFRQLWLYSAIAGIAIMFVLNLGVSFAIASLVALRAYDVPREEHLSILRSALQQILRSPLRFLFPVEPKHTEPKPPVAPKDAELAADPRAEESVGNGSAS